MFFCLTNDFLKNIINHICLFLQEKMKGKNKLVPRLLGINKESVLRVDEKTKQVYIFISSIFYFILYNMDFKYHLTIE